MTLQVLIPCKPLAAGKSRLATLLDGATRQALCSELLRQTLELALTVAARQDCHVVTSDRAAMALAASNGIAALDDPDHGLNAALAAARDQLCRRLPPDAALLVLPIDLPCATSANLVDVCGRNADVVMAPDRARAGTNLLWLGSKAIRRFAFRFGPESFTRHRDQATAAGLRLELSEAAELAFDIDGPADYLEWQQAGMAKMPQQQV